MAYTTTTTSITSATSSRSKQATVYQYPTGNGVVITGASVNSNTTAYLGVTTPGAAQSYTAVSGGATITEIVYLDADNVPTNANAVSTTGGNIKIVGTGFASNSQVYINNALVTNTVPNSTAIIATLTTGSVGNVSCYIFGSGNSGGAISANSVRFSGAPSWVTAAAVSSVNGIASNIALQASGDGTLTYVLKSGSGSLPTGISLLSAGYLTGTATGYSADTVVTFTLIVRDSENQATQQTFNYTVFIGDTYFKQTSLLLSATVSNTFISDSSTNNFLITRNGDTRPSRFSPYWPGGWSAYFDGTGDYLDLPNNIAFHLAAGEFTIEFWVNTTTTADAWVTGYYKPNPGTLAEVSYAFLLQSGNWQFNLTSGSTETNYNFGNTTVISNGSWHHLAVTRQSNTVRLFLDGSLISSNTYTSTLNDPSSGVYRIGGATGSFEDPFSGYISNLRILKGTALYTANFTPNTTSLTTVANTSLLTLRDAILADDSPYNFAITRNGDTKLTTFSPFNTAPHTITANTNSVYFDGTGDYLTVPANSAFAFGTGDFTIEAWVYQFARNATYGAQIAGPHVYGVSADWLFIINTAGNLYFQISSSVAGAQTSTATVPLNTWSHVTVVRLNGNITFYINGVSAGTGSYTTSITNESTALGIGAATNGNAGSTLTGYISNLRIVKGTAVYTANFTPATSALTAISGTSLLACQANTIIDSNTTPKTITVNGTPNVSLANPFGETVTTISNYSWSANSYGASAYFDGTGDSLTTNYSINWSTFGSYTLEFWAYFTSIAGVNFGFFQTGGTGYTNGYIYGSTGTYPGAIAIGIQGTNEIRSANSVIGANQWYHIAYTYNGTTTKIYVNGKEVASATTAVYSNNTGNLSIGSAVGYVMNGYISDFRIHKGTPLYTTSFIPPTAPVSNVANVSLLTLQSDIGSNSAQFLDQSPNNHLITRNGNASQGTYSPLVPSTWSAYFDGTGDYLSIPRNAAFFPLANEDFTFEAWVYLTATPGAQGAAVMGTGEYGLDSDWNININSSLRVVFYLDATLTEYINTTGTVTLNTWNHVAVSRSGTGSNNLKVFLNGFGQSFTTNSTTVSIGNRALTIGADQNGDEFLLTGYISNLRIVKGTALYTANFTPSTTTISPVTNTSLLTLRGPAFTDDSGNNFTITRNGDTKIVPFGPFSPQIVTPDSYSYRFSNASDYISTTSSNLAFGSNNWTIESWVYPRFTANSGVFQVSNVQYGLTNSNLNTVALGFSNSNKAIVRVANATYTSTGTTITANTWTHLALVKSSNVSKLYINGTLDSTIGTSGSITDTVSYTGTTNVAVGGYGSTSALANAYISNFRIVSNSAVYTENFTPAVGPLTSISGTTLLTCQANTVIDSSTANLTITANANVRPSNFNPFDETVTVGQAYSAQADGGSAYFDGNGDYLILPLDVIRQIPNNTYTIEFWLYATSTTCPIFLATANNVSFFAIIGFYISNGTLNFEVRPNTGSGFPAVVIESAITINTWNHVTVSVNNGSAILYVNGSRVGSGTVGTLTDSAFTGLGIGYWPNGFSATTFTGYISNFRVIKGNALYTANFVPPAAPALPTVANTSLLLNFTSSGVIDSTGRNVLETVGNARSVTSTIKYGTGSYFFDGTTNCRIQIANNTASDLFNMGTGDHTVEFWVKTIGTPASQQCLFDFRNADTTNQGIAINLTASRTIVLYYTANRITSAAIAADTWTHIAVARASGVYTLYINGTSAGTYSNSDTVVPPANRPYIGSVNDNSQVFNGYIADVRVTKGYARYTANFTVPSEPFITK